MGNGPCYFIFSSSLSWHDVNSKLGKILTLQGYAYVSVRDKSWLHFFQTAVICMCESNSKRIFSFLKKRQLCQQSWSVPDANQFICPFCNFALLLSSYRYECICVAPGSDIIIFLFFKYLCRRLSCRMKAYSYHYNLFLSPILMFKSLGFVSVLCRVKHCKNNFVLGVSFAVINIRGSPGVNVFIGYWKHFSENNFLHKEC